MIETLQSLLETPGLYVDATLLVALFGIVWGFAQRVAGWVFFQMSLRTRTVELDFHTNADVPAEISALKLLIIRYGNDTYLKELASDTERHHGRLRNSVHSVQVKDAEDGGKLIVAKLRIHKRLGTQFKFFVDVEGETDRVVSYLKTHAAIDDVDVTPQLVYQGKSRGHKRLFFLVKDFEEVRTVDGFVNNMIYPV